MSAEVFTRLLDTFYQSWLRYHPECAVALGVEGYGGRLTPYGDDEIGALIALIEKMLSELEALDLERLDPDQQIDYRLLLGSLLLEHHSLLEADWRHRDPLRYIPISAIRQLVLYPVADFARHFADRLEAVPHYLRGAKAHIGEIPELIPALWLETAIQEAESGAAYLRELANHSRVQQQCVRQDEAKRLLEQAAHAVEDFAHYLEKELAPHAQGDLACGVPFYEQILSERHFLGPDTDQIRRLGLEALSAAEAELKALTQSVQGNEDYQSLWQKIAADCPKQDQLLDRYREQFRLAWNFLDEKDLVTRPQTQQLRVMETPEFLRRRIPTVTYRAPAVTDAHHGGYCYVTTNAPDSAHCLAAIRNASARLAWPGRHLLQAAAHAGAESRSLPRLLNPSSVMQGGWMLYSQQLMLEQGHLAKPEDKFIYLKNKFDSSLQLLLDVDLHTSEISSDQYVEQLQDRLGVTPELAKSWLLESSRNPTRFIGALLGSGLLNRLRDQQQQSGDFDLKLFHDQLVSSGPIALPLMVQRQFGQTVWQAISN